MHRALTGLACTIAALLQPAEAAAGDNTLEYHVFSKIYEGCIAGSKLTDTDPGAETADATKILVALNVSAADDKFYDQDFDSSDAKTSKDKNYTIYRTTWLEVVKKIRNAEAVAGNVKLPRVPQGPQREMVQRIEENALRTIQAAIDAAPKSKTAAEIDPELKEVLYGSGQASASTADGQTFHNTMTKACGDTGAGSEEPGLSLYNDLACLCGGGNTAIEGCAGSGVNLGGVTPFSSSATGPAAVGAVLAKCPKPPANQENAELLAAASRDFLHLLGSRNTATADNSPIYGKATQCSATNKEGCVNYKTKVQGNHLKIPWLDKLLAALADIKAHNKRSDAIRQLGRHATATMETALQQVKLAERTLTAATTQPPATAVTPALATNKRECEQHKNNKTTCENAGKCKWEPKDGKSETEGECKPKPGTDNTAAGTGAVDKKDGDKKDEVCTGTEEKDCDKNKCTWDKEKTQCKVKEGAAVISAVIKAPLLLAFLLF
uniref:Variant surface glycoprotein n=1 Tax=Trypanosoma brucei TaxID=5691 RepID=A0A1V0FZ60_9TRYP|nr:variant surface glycoprotein [Trypanosoma brucei]